ncbi:MAG: two-component system, chemotaxis family, protein-glutamate methylesterase/glutaminase [Clostridiales bacterium]|nr:two-component system, chemotaxis family, protein-glutamate methylesterase/glutaminase [Clostridiales bacterium]
MKKIRVLVVDDSYVFQQLLLKWLSNDKSLEVVGVASNPFEARDKILELAPDVMTCDIEMPRMNGIAFLEKLMPQYPIAVVVVSSVSTAVFDAMNAGAVDFVAKPQVQTPQGVEIFLNELMLKIKIASVSNVSGWKANPYKRKQLHSVNHSQDKVIAIGASTGGTEAIFQILKAFPSDVPGILIVQHIPPSFSEMFAQRLNRTTSLYVKEAKNGDLVEPGTVLIAPGDQHMRIKRIGEGYKVMTENGARVNGHCPSVDVLFESVAREVGENAIGVILTGMGYDGAKGLLAMKRRGARTIGQNEKSCVVYGMPKVAYDIGGVERQLALDEISEKILTLIGTF